MQSLIELIHRYNSLYVLTTNAIIIGIPELKMGLFGAGKSLENRLKLAELKNHFDINKISDH